MTTVLSNKNERGLVVLGFFLGLLEEHRFAVGVVDRIEERKQERGRVTALAKPAVEHLAHFEEVGELVANNNIVGELTTDERAFCVDRMVRLEGNVPVSIIGF